MKPSIQFDEVNVRSLILTNLSDFCHFAKHEHYISIIEWENGEGFDIVVDDIRGTQRISITHGEFEAIKLLNANL